MKKAIYKDGYQVLAPLDIGEERVFTINWTSRDIGTQEIVHAEAVPVEGNIEIVRVDIMSSPGKPPKQATTFRVEALDGPYGRALVAIRITTDKGEKVKQTFHVPIQRK